MLRFLRFSSPLKCAMFWLLLVGTGTSVVAQEWPRDSWPQWGGPNRDHQSRSTGLLQTWPAEGPDLAWRFNDAGKGYSSFSVLDGQLLTLGNQDGHNFLICLNSEDGSEIWRTVIGAEAPEESYNQDWQSGPRSTPTIAGDRVVVLDDAGNLACLNRHQGELIWSVNLVEAFGGRIPRWGYSASPLVDGDRVVVCPGMSQFLVALDIETGAKLLTSSGFDQVAHYVSVVKHTVDEIPMYVTAAESGLVAFSAESGEVLWQNSRSGNATATVTTPITRGNYVYHTSTYATGCVLVEVTTNDDKVEAREIYHNLNQQNHHGGVVLVGDYLFGYRRRGGMVCQHFLSGDLVWSERISGDASASIAYADQRLYVYGENTGACYLVEPSSEGWTQRGKLTIPEQTKIDRRNGKIWAHPVIAEGKLFLRDMDLIYAYDIE